MAILSSCSPTMLFKSFPTLRKFCGELPLDVHMDIISPAALNQKGSEAQIAPLFPWDIAHSLVLGGILAARAYKIKCLTISSEIYHPIAALLRVLAGRVMPLLERLECSRNKNLSSHFEQSDLPPPCFSLLQALDGVIPSPQLNARGFPELHHVALSGIPHVWSQFIPRHNLVSLSLEYLPLNRRPTYFELKNMLLSSQQTLQRLKLWVVAPDPEDGLGSQGKIILPQLKELSIGFAFPEYYIFLIEHLEVPSLVSFELCQMPYQFPDNDYVSRALFLGAVIKALPLRQITHLTLRGTSFCPENLDELDHCFFKKEEHQNPPLMFTFFFSCPPVRFLRLIDCDQSTLHCLATPLYISDVSPSGLFPCSILEQLEIQTDNLDNITHFFKRDAFWTNTTADLVLPRTLGALLLDVPPEWGTKLRDLMTGNAAELAWNTRSGYFEVEDAGVVGNLMELLNVE
ncbi:hypothetical protein GYMLUDRAFT_264426 [Collybiopsis luxurians FD-317 M1]|uniref:F-box domain-containing protein n=1 Tax=Collybiopsis luxurians FD-317 M1 TaxID=944289 RepID=A0A0D0CIM3_9AGAR|nr:hypothetical protein GYMLUDRAFT_264426 [Collybiopsis luxurians FD-317 M1]